MHRLFPGCIACGIKIHAEGFKPEEQGTIGTLTGYVPLSEQYSPLFGERRR